ncbi:MAG: helicase-related protein [Microcoleaceae cyanobacterium]
MNSSNLGQDLGRLFEVGFNIGMLTYLKQKQIQSNYGDLYEKDLQQLSFPKIIRKLIDNERIINQQDRNIVNQWATFFLQKSFLAGLNFLDEYFAAIGWNNPRKLKALEVVYYQCNFTDDNSIGTYHKGDQQVYQDWFSQLRLNLDQIDTHHYSQRGEFLKADSLVFFRYKHQVRILTIDYSIFSIKSIQDLEDLSNIEVLRQIILSNISYLKSKSVFANLGLDSQNNQFFFSESLSQYYKAFVRKDKETIKMIQAGSYTYSFWKWLNDRDLIDHQDDITFNIMGYSDRDVASLCLKPNQINILETCYQIYRNKSINLEVDSARERVLNIIKRKACYSFKNGKKLVEDLLNVSGEGIHSVSHQETFSDFNSYLDLVPTSSANSLNLPNNLNLQQAHAQLIQQALSANNKNLYVFLTGNPGIGKTTAISNFLKQEQILEEGFLFLYISPRTQVNLDIIEKFRDDLDSDKSLFDDRLTIINTNSNLIDSNEGKLTVQYSSNLKKDRFCLKGVDFIPQDESLKFNSNSQSSVTRKTATRLKDSKNKKKGVLYSLCEALNSLINNEQNNIVATVALQSLKEYGDGSNTLKHFKRIFRDIYNETEGKVIPAKLQQLSQNIKHIFIAIDEITGDHSGVNFLLEMSQYLQKYQLTNKAYFNTKLIVADASIIDSEVIQQHLSKTTVEPNKIFFRKAKINHACIHQENFEFNNQPAIVINTNSYPAKNLQVTYKTFIYSLKYKPKNEKIYKTAKYDLEDRVNSAILKDVELIKTHSPNEQIIIYIQDKARLSQLIESFRENRKRFKAFKDYIEIHADLSDSDKQKIHQYKNDVEIIFMTASASRGLSFPYVQHILVDLPRFEIEANLMEVIQVIYRGRGNREIDVKDKQLIFYLTEQAVYYTEDRKFSLQESKLNLLNFLIILHVSIQTRIYGSGNIANEQYMMIPVGGKSVFSAGESLSHTIKTLMTKLKKESRRYSHDLRFQQAYQLLEEMMNTVEITISKSVRQAKKEQLTYLKLIEEVRDNFIKKIEGNLDALLSFPIIQTGYVVGGLLIVPLTDQIVEEVYRVKTDKKIVVLADILSELQTDSRLPETMKRLIRDTLDLILELQKEPDKNQKLELESQYLDQYYAIPLFVLSLNHVFDNYFQNKETEPEDQRFREILETYVKSLFPITQVLPIAYQYEKLPFLVFRSYSLIEMKNKRFSDQYLINSKELNVLDLVLAESDETD